MNPPDPRNERLVRHVDGRLSEAEADQVAASLRSNPEARRFLREMAEQAVMIADLERETHGRRAVMQEHAIAVPARGRLARILTPSRPFGAALAMAASIVIFLSAGLLFYKFQHRGDIATITALDGAIQWTGDGGRVVRNLTIGTKLQGGIIEGIEPLSWFELQFTDGTTVEITGNSTLTFSDLGQKRLQLKSGTASANVRPQPPGRPMVMQTTSAALEVLGTQFAIETDTSATRLDVTQGKVRVKRLSDGADLDVPARHRVLAAADRDFTVLPALAPVDNWTSHLPLGPEDTLGKWTPPKADHDASLFAVPFTSRPGWTIFAAATGVSAWNAPPVRTHPDTHLRFRGRLATSSAVYFGVTMRDANGAFAGRFQTVRSSGEFAAGEDFDVTLPLRDFVLDPVLKPMAKRLPARPFELTVESVWCHTLTRPAGLQLFQAQVIPPAVP
jgi:ferric-dicitrate binding protein FerR (iron transport regulator)